MHLVPFLSPALLLLFLFLLLLRLLSNSPDTTSPIPTITFTTTSARRSRHSRHSRPRCEIPRGRGDIDLGRCRGDLANGYGDGGFRVSQERYAGDLFLLPRQAMSWQVPADLDSLSADDLLALMGETPPPLLILGAGEAPR